MSRMNPTTPFFQNVVAQWVPNEIDNGHLSTPEMLSFFPHSPIIGIENVGDDASV